MPLPSYRYVHIMFISSLCCGPANPCPPSPAGAAPPSITSPRRPRPAVCAIRVICGPSPCSSSICRVPLRSPPVFLLEYQEYLCVFSASQRLCGCLFPPESVNLRHPPPNSANASFPLCFPSQRGEYLRRSRSARACLDGPLGGVAPAPQPVNCAPHTC